MDNKRMEEKIRELGSYEIVEGRQVPDLNSYGYLLRHKKTGARVTPMMTAIRCFISVSVRRPRIVRGWPILLNIRFCAARKISL